MALASRRGDWIDNIGELCYYFVKKRIFSICRFFIFYEWKLL